RGCGHVSACRRRAAPALRATCGHGRVVPDTCRLRAPAGTAATSDGLQDDEEPLSLAGGFAAAGRDPNEPRNASWLSGLGLVDGGSLAGKVSASVLSSAASRIRRSSSGVWSWSSGLTVGMFLNLRWFPPPDARMSWNGRPCRGQCARTLECGLNVGQHVL